MANIVPSIDGKLNVEALTALWTDEISPLCLKIFAYNGAETPEISQDVTQARASVQVMESYIAKILADLPA